MSGLRITTTGNPSSVLGYIGGRQNILDGCFSHKMETTFYQAKEFKYGCSLASPIDKNSIGESILVNERCFAECTDKDSELYQKLIYGSEFVTSSYFLIPNNQYPSHVATLPSDQYQVADVYQALYDKFARPIAFTGWVKFIELNSVSIGEPPIHNRNIKEHKDVYYPLPPTLEPEICGFVVGVISKQQEGRFHQIHEQIANTLYRKQESTDGLYLFHTHVLLLPQHCTQKEDITPSKVSRCVELVNEKTIISGLDIEIYTIEDLTSYG